MYINPAPSSRLQLLSGTIDLRPSPDSCHDDGDNYSPT